MTGGRGGSEKEAQQGERCYVKKLLQVRETPAPSPDCAPGDKLLTIHKGDISGLQVLHLGGLAMSKQETKRRHRAQAGKD